MWYFANPSTQQVRNAMRDHRNRLGMIVTPAQGNVVDPDFVTIVDNGAFGKKGYPGDDTYLNMLDKRVKGRGACWFATAPDVPGNAAATLERSAPMLPRIRRAGFRAALCAQNGLERLRVPWNTFDVLFLGGSPECRVCGYVRPVRDRKIKRCPSCERLLEEWKTSTAARELMREAVERGKDGHMGRANSYERLALADDFGCKSADGTHIARGPDINLPEALGWLRAIQAKHAQPALFDLALREQGAA